MKWYCRTEIEETCEIQGKMSASWFSHEKLVLFSIYEMPIIKRRKTRRSFVTQVLYVVVAAAAADAAAMCWLFKNTKKKKKTVFIIDAREILKAVQL